MKEFLLMAAPMEDNTDSNLRTLFHRHGADITFTEMVRVKALAAGNKSTWSRMETNDDTPFEIQLLASSESDLEKFLSGFTPPPGFRGFNMNLGCPAPDVIRAGLGSAMMKRVAKTQRLIDVFRKHEYPISIKFRLGLNDYEKRNKAYANLIRNTTPDYFIVHLRHAGQTYSEPADWGVVPEILSLARETGKKIVINGDIYRKDQVDELREKGAYGAMIGRAAVYDPSIFDRLKGRDGAPIDALREEYLSLCEAHPSHERFARNVLKRMGRDAKSIDAKLLI